MVLVMLLSNHELRNIEVTINDGADELEVIDVE